MTPTIIPAAEPSILDRLYAMVSPATETPAKPAVEAPKEATPEPVTEQAKTIEADKGTVEEKQSPDETEDHTPLPPAAQKRLDKEIARTVSARKAVEEELKRLKEKPTPAIEGTEPVKPAAEAKGRPVRPTPPVFGDKDSETWDDFTKRQQSYQADLAKYDDAIIDWAGKQSEEAAERRITQRQAQESHQRVIEQAVKDHGSDFIALTEAVASKAPLELQHAILKLDDWPTVAVYLARNGDRLDEVVAKFKTNEVAAIATLGRIQAALKSSGSKGTAAERELPAPLRPVAGTASATTAKTDLNKLSETDTGAMQSELAKMFPEKVRHR